MSQRAKLLKVSAMIGSFLVIIFLMFNIILSIIDGFKIYTYFIVPIVVISDIRLWKMYIDERKLG